MSWAELLLRAKSQGIAIPPESLRRPFVHIDSEHQLLRLIAPDDGQLLCFPVSTSRYGLGQQNGSFRTPTGIHRIAELIGDCEPCGRVFKAREPQNQICLPSDYDGESDVITSRILWLDGLEPGFNHDGEVDTHERFIYIHGTPDEANLGRPASIGCIRLSNQNVIELYERVAIGDLVFVQ